MFPCRAGTHDNPYLAILTAALAQEGVRCRPLLWPRMPDALHVHWLEAPLWGRIATHLPLLAELRVGVIWLLARLLRGLGRPVIWTAHNLAPHDFANARHRRLYARMRAGFLPLVSDVICMGHSAGAEVRAAFPELAGARFHLIPHPGYGPHFDGIAPQTPPELAGLSLPETTPLIATFGHVRAYKGLPALVLQLRQSPLDFRFVIAGKGPEPEMAALVKAIDQDPRILFVPRRISDAEVVGLTRRAALVLFNFQTLLNSGSVLASLSLGRPVLAPALGLMTELQGRLGPDWVHLFHGPITAERVAAALAMPPKTRGPDLRGFAPDQIARQHAAIYRGQPLHRGVLQWS